MLYANGRLFCLLVRRSHNVPQGLLVSAQPEASEGSLMSACWSFGCVCVPCRPDRVRSKVLAKLQPRNILFFFFSRGTGLGSKIGLKLCSPSQGGFMEPLFNIIKSRVSPDLRSEELIANNVQDARGSPQSLTSELIDAPKEVKV